MKVIKRMTSKTKKLNKDVKKKVIKSAKNDIKMKAKKKRKKRKITYTEIEYPKYEKASECHKEIIDKILRVNDYCLVMNDSLDREMLIYELIDKVKSDIPDFDASKKYALLASNTGCVSFPYLFNLDYIATLSSQINIYEKSLFDDDYLELIKNAKILIIDNIDASTDQIIIDKLNRFVSDVRDNRKDLRIVYFVENLFNDGYRSFRNMIKILNLKTARLNHMVENLDLMDIFIETKNGKTEFKNLDLISKMYEKHFYLEPLEQIRRLNFNIVKMYESDDEKEIAQKIIDNIDLCNFESKKYRKKKKDGFEGMYYKCLNMVVDETSPQDKLFDKEVDKKRYKIIKDNSFNQLFYIPNDRKEIYLTNQLCSLNTDNRKHIKSIHLVKNSGEPFLDDFLRCAYLLYNGDYSDDIRFFVYFLDKPGGIRYGSSDNISNYFNYENIDDYRKLMKAYNDLLSSTKVSEYEKTFDDIIAEILGEK